MSYKTTSIKVKEVILEKIAEYGLTNEIGRSEAIRQLIDLGLKASVDKGKEHSHAFKDEMIKMNIDMWLFMGQIYNLLDYDIDKIPKIKKELIKKQRFDFAKKFENIHKHFKSYLQNPEDQS